MPAILAKFAKMLANFGVHHDGLAKKTGTHNLRLKTKTLKIASAAFFFFFCSSQMVILCCSQFTKGGLFFFAVHRGKTFFFHFLRVGIAVCNSVWPMESARRAVAIAIRPSHHLP